MKNKEKCIEGGGWYCPHCGKQAELITEGDQGIGITETFVCDECGASWIMVQDVKEIHPPQDILIEAIENKLTRGPM